MKIEAKQRLAAELTEKQKQLDINGDGKIDAEDLKRLRKGEKPEKVESSAKGLATTIRNRLGEDGVAVSAVVTIGPASTFQYDWDGVEYDESAVASSPASVLEIFMDPKMANSRAIGVSKMGLEVVRCTVGGYTVIVNLSAATVTVVQG